MYKLCTKSQENGIDRGHKVQLAVFSWGEANQWISLVWSSQSFQLWLLLLLLLCASMIIEYHWFQSWQTLDLLKHAHRFENVQTLDELKNRCAAPESTESMAWRHDVFPFTAALLGRDQFFLSAEARCLELSWDWTDDSRLLPVQQVLRFSWPEIAPQAPSSKPQHRYFVKIRTWLWKRQQKVNAGYLGPKTPATHLAGASKQGDIHSKMFLPFSSYCEEQILKVVVISVTKTGRPQLERVHFSEVAAGGNLWSAVLQAWINGDTRHEFNAVDICWIVESESRVDRWHMTNSSTAMYLSILKVSSTQRGWRTDQWVSLSDVCIA